MNHFASKIVVVAQDNLMQARDERVSLMNEVRFMILLTLFLISCFICVTRFSEGFVCSRHVNVVTSMISLSLNGYCSLWLGSAISETEY